MAIVANISRVSGGAGGPYAYTIVVDGAADTVDIGNANVGAAFNEVRDRIVALASGQTVKSIRIGVEFEPV